MTRRRRYVSEAEATHLGKLAEKILGRAPSEVRFHPDGRVDMLDQDGLPVLAPAAGENAPGGGADADETFDAWKRGAA